MADISPFRGVLYRREDSDRIGNLVAPPYDMISPREQRDLYERHPHNFVRLILGIQNPGDGSGDNRYTRAAATLSSWLKEGVLRPDTQPAIYVYEQEYSLPRRTRLARRGFIALARLEELGEGGIHPHEKTLSGPKEDRLQLMLACRANFSQIFSFYDDPAGEVDKAIADAMTVRPRFDFVDSAGVRHVLTSLTDPAALSRVRALMSRHNLFIADGHHRYETALNFRRIMRERLGERYPESYDRVMMYFANMSSPGLTILPFHRIVSLPRETDGALLLARLSKLGKLSKLAPKAERMETITSLLDLMAQTKEGEHRFGVWVPPDFHLLEMGPESLPPAGADHLVEDLDVSVLHRVVLERSLGPELPQSAIDYTTRERDLLEIMDGRKEAVAFLLNPTRVDQVRDIAAAGLRMPPKSTNFHPKLISGLVFNLLDEGAIQA